MQDPFQVQLSDVLYVLFTYNLAVFVCLFVFTATLNVKKKLYTLASY